MDWFAIAQDDWGYYQDTTRIADYVKFNKITAEQYQVITDEFIHSIRLFFILKKYRMKWAE